MLCGQNSKRLIYNEPRLAERLEVEAVDAVGERLYRAHFGSPEIATREAHSVIC